MTNPLCLSCLGSSLVWVDLLAILVVADAGWWETVSAAFAGTDTMRELSAMLFSLRKEVRPRFISVRNVPNNLAMNGARDTVLQLEVHLGNSVFWEYGCIRDITNGSLESFISNFPFSNQAIEKRGFLLTDSTIFLIVKRLIALSLGVHREQLEHRIGFT